VELGSVRSSWVIANADSQGYYRVLYSRQIYKELTKQLKLNHHALSTIERSSIINDMFAFLKAGYLEVDTVFDLIQYVAGKLLFNSSIHILFQTAKKRV
jgi:hypothetical protein